MIHTSHHQSVLSDAIRAFRDIGYRPGWLKHDYEFSDLYAPNTPSRTIDLGVFAQEPSDYRSASFGLLFAREGEKSIEVLEKVRAFGAPQIFYVRNDTVERWKVRIDGGELAEIAPLIDLPKLITDHAADWNPAAVLRAKGGFARPGPRSLDFVDLGLLPALEHEAARKIDELVRITCALVENEYQGRSGGVNATNLFSLVFQLLVGKLLLDRGIKTSPAIDFDDVQTVLDAVRNHYPSHDHNVLRHLKLSKSLASSVAKEIGQSFSFANLSAETLTYVYENTFVSAPSRKTLGIHSTPSYIADYILAQLPIEELDKLSWNVLDPTCGHGIFLIAAMRRMRAHLPPDWSARKRHDYFVRRLHGVDMEGFSLEVAKLCLMLADFPEANGWDLIQSDIFTPGLLEQVAGAATIVVGNPPFEVLEGVTPLRRKPAELLVRALPAMPEGGLLGMVLPRAFLDGNDYKNERKQMLGDFDLLSITALPDKIFTYSDAETAIVVARKGKQPGAQFYFREVYDQDKSNFKKDQAVSWEDVAPADYFAHDKEHGFVVPRLRHLWEHLEDLPKFSTIASIRTGIRYKKGVREDVKHPTKQARNRKLGIAEVDDNFMQFSCHGQVLFALDPELQQNAAWTYDWDSKKVIVPASRNSRGAWRYAAALDESGLCVSRRFYGVWPAVDGINEYVLAALLNSPLAEAYVFTHSFQRDIRVQTYEDIPIPPAEKLAQSAQAIESLVREYKAVADRVSVNPKVANQLLLRIDAEILKLYDLPPRLERSLLDLFWGYNDRHVPFDFYGYMPPTYRPALPLHIYISSAFEESKAENLLAALPKSSPAMLDFLKSLDDGEND